MTRVNKIILFLLSIITINLFSQEKWEVLENKEYNFKISFPAKYNYSKDTIPNEKFTVYKHNWDVEIVDSLKPYAYMRISVCPYPSNFIHSDSSSEFVDDVLNSTRDAISQDEQIVLSSTIIIEKEGYPGKQFVWKHIKTDEEISVRIYLIDSTIFTMLMSTEQPFIHHTATEAFFSTFELVNKKKGKFTLTKPVYKPTYSIDFPEPPVYNFQILEKDSLKLNLHSQTGDIEDKTDNLGFFSSEVKYPDIFPSLNDYTYNLFYSTTYTAVLARMGAELIAMKDINYEGTPGKELKAYIYKGQAIVVLRYFLIDNTLYQYGVITNPESDGNYEMKKFLDSFKVL